MDLIEKGSISKKQKYLSCKIISVRKTRKKLMVKSEWGGALCENSLSEKQRRGSSTVQGMVE